MKIGAMVPQGWRMDLNGINPEDQWDTILEASSKIENLKYESVWVYDHFHTVPSHQLRILRLNAGHLWRHYLR